MLCLPSLSVPLPLLSLSLQVDPLDAFMQSLSGEEKKRKRVPRGEVLSVDTHSGLDAYNDHKAAQAAAGRKNSDKRERERENEDEEWGDSDEEREREREEITPLPSLDHSQVVYVPLTKMLLSSSLSLSSSPSPALDAAKEARERLGVTVSSLSLPAPWESFSSFQVDQRLLKAIEVSVLCVPLFLFSINASSPSFFVCISLHSPSLSLTPLPLLSPSLRPLLSLSPPPLHSIRNKDMRPPPRSRHRLFLWLSLVKT